MNMLMLQSTAVLGRMMHKVLVHIHKYLNADAIAYLCYYAHMNVCMSYVDMSYVDMSLKRNLFFSLSLRKAALQQCWIPLWVLASGQ